MNASQLRGECTTCQCIQCQHPAVALSRHASSAALTLNRSVRSSSTGLQQHKGNFLERLQSEQIPHYEPSDLLLLTDSCVSGEYLILFCSRSWTRPFHSWKVSLQKSDSWYWQTASFFISGKKIHSSMRCVIALTASSKSLSQLLLCSDKRYFVRMIKKVQTVCDNWAQKGSEFMCVTVEKKQFLPFCVYSPDPTVS